MLPQMVTERIYGDLYGDPYGDYGVAKRATLAHFADQKIEQAEAGQSLDAYNSEKHPNAMFAGMSDDEEAHYHAAYWYAVAAKIALGEGNKTAANKFIRLAKENYMDAAKMGLVPFYGNEWKRGPQIVSKLRGDLGKSLGDKGRALAAAMTRGGTEGSRKIREKAKHETSLTGKVIDPIVMTGQDIAKGAGQAASFWGKYGKWISVGIGVLAVSIWAAPVVMPAIARARVAGGRARKKYGPAIGRAKARARKEYGRAREEYGQYRRKREEEEREARREKREERAERFAEEREARLDEREARAEEREARAEAQRGERPRFVANRKRNRKRNKKRAGSKK
jgi:hypothetical protein